MASLKKKSITRPMPEGAELFTRGGVEYARWTAKGKTRTARITTGADGARRVLVDSAVWYARVRMADQTVRDIPTGCRDKSAAAARMAELAAVEEKIRAGIVTQAELKTAHHGRAPLRDVIKAFGRAMSDKKRSARHVAETMRYLERAADGTGWRTLADMDGARLDAWITAEGFGARVANHFIVAFKSFATWAARRGYLAKTPFAHLERRNERADRRHVRRALSVDELARLFEAARTRPMLEAAKINRGKNKGKAGAELSARTLDRLRFTGWTRSLAYKTAALTGLRWGELRSITIGAARLDADPPHFILEAKNEKARRGAQIALQGELAAELRLYLAERLSRLVGHSGASVAVFPGALDGAALFDVPPSMARTFDADCKAAGIPKKDGAGRVVDIHALRHTFGTLLAKAGISLQVTQKAMRHSTPTLTANVYTHLGLLDVAGAVDRLPNTGATVNPQQAEKVVNYVAPNVAPVSDIPGNSGATIGNSGIVRGVSGTNGNISILPNKDGAGQRGAISKMVNGAGLEPATTGLKVRCSTN